MLKPTIIILLLYVFFRDFRPSESYLTEYLREYKNLTKSDVNNKVYPVWSYSQLPFIIFVLSTTDIFRFRPLIWIGALGYVATWLILIFGSGVAAMQGMQVTYALGTACEIAYKSYVYVAVPREDYTRTSFLLTAATLLGRSLSSFASELLVDYASVSLYTLNWISLISVVIAMVLSLLIPAPEFLPPAGSDSSEEEVGPMEVIRERLSTLRRNVFLSYKSAQTRRWTYWAVVCFTLYFMVGNSSQSFWKEIEPKRTDFKRLNGYVIGATSLLSSLTSWTLTRYSRRLENVTGSFLALLVLAMSLTVLLPTLIPNLYLAYTADLFFNLLTSCTTTIATFKIAHSLTTNLFGFVVGVNSCLASLVDLLASFIVMDDRALGMDPRDQYRVYAGMGLVSVVGYLGYLVMRGLVKWRRSGGTGLVSQFYTESLIDEPADEDILNLN